MPEENKSQGSRLTFMKERKYQILLVFLGFLLVLLILGSATPTATEQLMWFVAVCLLIYVGYYIYTRRQKEKSIHEIILEIKSDVQKQDGTILDTTFENVMVEPVSDERVLIYFLDPGVTFQYSKTGFGLLGKNFKQVLDTRRDIESSEIAKKAVMSGGELSKLRERLREKGIDPDALMGEEV